MSEGIRASQKNKFIKATFLQACRLEVLHGRWMTADTWAELMCLCFNLEHEQIFTGKDLAATIGSRANEALRNAMDVSHQNVPIGHLGIFRGNLRDAQKRPTHCFYACKSGERPPSSSKTLKELISDSNDLFTKFKLRGAKQETTETLNAESIDDCRGRSAGQKRKVPRSP